MSKHLAGVTAALGMIAGVAVVSAVSSPSKPLRPNSSGSVCQGANDALVYLR